LTGLHQPPALSTKFATPTSDSSSFEYENILVSLLYYDILSIFLVAFV